MIDLTHEGEVLVKNWRSAIEKHGLQKAAMNNAENELQRATEKLSQWLLPDDAEPGEQFCVWYRDSLIVTKEPRDEEPYTVTIRKRGKSLL